MKRFVKVVGLAVGVAASAQPVGAVQQDIAVGARLGTLGIGAEVAVELHDRLAIRGGAGFLGFNLDLTGMFGLASNRTAELSLPAMVYTLGAELSSGPFRVGAGLLRRSGDPTHEIAYQDSATIDIGGSFYQYPEVHTLTTTLVSGSTTPYVLFSLGSTPARGFGVVVDLGAVLHLNPQFDMTATGDPAVLNSSRFQTDLETERRSVEDDASRFVNFWPMLSVGLRYGLR